MSREEICQRAPFVDFTWHHKVHQEQMTGVKAGILDMVAQQIS
jgi:hypothetical protein